MTTTLSVALPEAVLAKLRQRAVEKGCTPEALIAQDVELANKQLKPGELLRPWAGSADSGRDDVAARYHEYLGQNLADKLHGE